MRIEFTRFGLKHDYRGAHVTYTLAGRDYLAKIVGASRDAVRGCFMLELRHNDGSEAPSVCASAVNVLEREWSNQ